jgi:hypothetical protein
MFCLLRHRVHQALFAVALLGSELDDGEEVIVTGDFNDYDGETRDARGSIPSSR